MRRRHPVGVALRRTPLSPSPRRLRCGPTQPGVLAVDHERAGRHARQRRVRRRTRSSVRAPTARKCSDATHLLGVSTAAIGTPRACPSATRSSIVCVGEQLAAIAALSSAGRGIAIDDALELGIGELLGLTEPRPHPAPLAGRQQADPDVAVAAWRTSDRSAGSGACRATVAEAFCPTAAWPSDPNGGSSVCRTASYREKSMYSPAPQRNRLIVGGQRRPGRLHRRRRRRDALRRQRPGGPVVGPDRDSAVDIA